VATSTFLLVVFAQAVGLTVRSEDRFREREYMAVLAQTVRLALDFERIVVAGLATSVLSITAMFTFPKCAPHVASDRFFTAGSFAGFLPLKRKRRTLGSAFPESSPPSNRPQLF
jgi:hypothetical protein